MPAHRLLKPCSRRSRCSLVRFIPARPLPCRSSLPGETRPPAHLRWSPRRPSSCLRSRWSKRKRTNTRRRTTTRAAIAETLTTMSRSCPRGGANTRESKGAPSAGWNGRRWRASDACAYWGRTRSNLSCVRTQVCPAMRPTAFSSAGSMRKSSNKSSRR